MGPGERHRASAIIVAGGASTRMGFDKVWADLCGRPLLAWSLLAFGRCQAVDELILVVAAASVERGEGLAAELGLAARVVAGGPRRRDSVRNGLELADGDWVLVHDAARPLVQADLIERGLAAARETGGAIAALPEPNTLKHVEGGKIVETLDRSHVWIAQTPQVFRRDLLLEAHRRSDEDATDDAALVEALGVPVRVYEGAHANIKVTTPVDLQFAALLAGKGPRPEGWP